MGNEIRDCRSGWEWIESSSFAGYTVSLFRTSREYAKNEAADLSGEKNNFVQLY